MPMRNVAAGGNHLGVHGVYTSDEGARYGGLRVTGARRRVV